MIEDAPDQVTVSCGVTALIANILDSQHLVAIAPSHGAQPMRFDASIGSRHPALIGAAARCFAGYSDIPDSRLLRTAARPRGSRAPTLPNASARSGQPVPMAMPWTRNPTEEKPS
jgi:DNA-binding IclR family transcriptional regulator